MATNPFTKAREKKGWSFTEASHHMRGVAEQQLRNLEGVGATRDTQPGNIRFATAIEIVKAYWPLVGVDDFISDPLLKFKPTSVKAERRLKGHVLD